MQRFILTIVELTEPEVVLTPERKSIMGQRRPTRDGSSQRQLYVTCSKAVRSDPKQSITSHTWKHYIRQREALRHTHCWALRHELRTASVWWPSQWLQCHAARGANLVTKTLHIHLTWCFPWISARSTARGEVPVCGQGGEITLRWGRVTAWLSAPRYVFTKFRSVHRALLQPASAPAAGLHPEGWGT